MREVVETGQRNSSPLSCTTHRHHVPSPTYTELHHVIPQAWQVLWQPPKPWVNQGASPDRHDVTTGKPYVLWDARTVALCRTGHGNVHYWLVKIMLEIGLRGDVENPVTWGKALGTVRAQARKDGGPLVRSDTQVAMQAITRYTMVGGKIADLLATHTLGYI